MWPFKKKREKVNASWGPFKVYDQCKECGCTETETPFVTILEGFLCPDCGSRDGKRVVGRWKFTPNVVLVTTWNTYHEFKERIEECLDLNLMK